MFVNMQYKEAKSDFSFFLFAGEMTSDDICWQLIASRKRPLSMAATRVIAL